MATSEVFGNCANNEMDHYIDFESINIDLTPKKKRGRPKGSKNKTHKAKKYIKNKVDNLIDKFFGTW